MSLLDKLLQQQGFDSTIDGCWDEDAQSMTVNLSYNGEWPIHPKGFDAASFILALAEDFEDRARSLRAELTPESTPEESVVAIGPVAG